MYLYLSSHFPSCSKFDYCNVDEAQSTQIVCVRDLLSREISFCHNNCTIMFCLHPATIQFTATYMNFIPRY